jgi:hypothetical protein
MWILLLLLVIIGAGVAFWLLSRRSVPGRLTRERRRAARGSER